MRFQFSDDMEYVYIQYDTGLIEAMPIRDLSEENKQFIWEQIAKEKL